MDFFFSQAHSNILERLMLKTHPSTLSQRNQRAWNMWFVNWTLVSPQAIHVTCSEAMHLPSTVCTHFLLIHGTDSKDNWCIWPTPTQSRFKWPAPRAEDSSSSGFKCLLCPELGPHHGVGLWCRTLLQVNFASTPSRQPFHGDAAEI